MVRRRPRWAVALMGIQRVRLAENGSRERACVSGPAATLLRIIAHDPDAVRRALLASPWKCRCRARRNAFVPDRRLTVSSRSLRAETRQSGVQAPNPATVRAMKHLDEGRGQRCDSAEELFRDLDI